MVLLREARATEKGLNEETRAIVKAVGRKRVAERLAEAGLELGETDWEAAQRLVAGATDEERQRAAGVYLVRDHAVDWLFDSRKTYFEDSPETP